MTTSRRKKTLVLALLAGEVLASIGMLIAALINIESILVTGPILSIAGLLLAANARRYGSIAALVYGLSGPSMCAFCAILIAVNSWGPSESGPIAAIITIYTLLAVPAAAIVFTRIQELTLASSAKQQPWRYSLKSLLILMTAVCILAAAMQALIRYAPHDESVLFGGYALVCVSASAVVVWRFVAATRIKRDPTIGCPQDEFANNGN